MMISISMTGKEWRERARSQAVNLMEKMCQRMMTMMAQMAES